MSASKAMLLTFCSTLLAVVSFGGLYQAIQPAPQAGPGARLVAPPGFLPPALAAPPRPAGARAPTPTDDDYEYCRVGRAPLALGSYDAVFALGAGLASERIDLNEVIRDGARLRPLAAWLAVAHFGAAARLGFSGGHTSGASAPSEAASMGRFVETAAFQARYGWLARAQPREVVLEEDSRSTDTNVARILELARGQRWGRVLLVTSQYHVARARLLADASRLPADVVSAEAIVDAAMADPTVHERLCEHERSEAVRGAIRQERTLVSVMGLLRG